MYELRAQDNHPEVYLILRLSIGMDLGMETLPEHKKIVTLGLLILEIYKIFEIM